MPASVGTVATHYTRKVTLPGPVRALAHISEASREHSGMRTCSRQPGRPAGSNSVKSAAWNRLKLVSLAASSVKVQSDFISPCLSLKLMVSEIWCGCRIIDLTQSPEQTPKAEAVKLLTVKESQWFTWMHTVSKKMQLSDFSIQNAPPGFQHVVVSRLQSTSD